MSDRTGFEVLVEALVSRYPALPRATIERLVAEEQSKFDDAPVRSFVPILVGRAAKARLLEADRLLSVPID